VNLDAIVEEVKAHGVGNINPYLTSHIPLKKDAPRSPTILMRSLAASPPAAPQKRRHVEKTPSPTRKRGAAPGAPRKVPYKRKQSGGFATRKRSSRSRKA
jgi:hypothetical protein